MHQPRTTNNNTTMKFAKTALSLLLLSRATSAWTLAAARPSSWARTRLIATQFHSAAATASDYSNEVVGQEKTESFRLSLKEGDATISPWHDIPYKNADGSYNMVRACVRACWIRLDVEC